MINYRSIFDPSNKKLAGIRHYLSAIAKQAYYKLS
jgi:hypothetical protein